jgi:hypothetical protein
MRGKGTFGFTGGLISLAESLLAAAAMPASDKLAAPTALDSRKRRRFKMVSVMSCSFVL